MNNHNDDRDRLDDADMHSLFDTDSVRVPRELDAHILGVAGDEVAALGEQTVVDRTALYRKGGLRGVVPQLMSIAAAIVFAVTLVPLMRQPPDSTVQQPNALNESVVLEPRATASTDELEDTFGAEVRRDSAAGTDLTSALVDDLGSSAANGGVESKVDQVVSDLDADDSDALALDESDFAASTEAADEPMDADLKTARAREALSAPELKLKKEAAAADRSQAAEPDTDTTAAHLEKSLSTHDTKFTGATAGIVNSLGNDSSGIARPIPNHSAIVNERAYRVDEKTWRTKILEFHDVGDTRAAKSELQLFRIVHPNSDWLKELPDGFEEKP